MIYNIIIPFASLQDGVHTSRARRSPRGTKTNIDHRTIFIFNKDYLVIDAPYKATIINVLCGFTGTMAADTDRLLELLKTLPQSDTISMTIDSKDFTLALSAQDFSVSMHVECVNK